MKDAPSSCLQRALEALGSLGPALTSNANFRETARKVLAAAMDVASSRAAVLFRFSEKPLMLRAVACRGFSEFPENAVIPLLPRHAYALGTITTSLPLRTERWDEFFSNDGNFNPALLHWIIPLKIGRRLVGLLALGEHAKGTDYSPEELTALELITHYVALAVQNQDLTETLAEYVTDNLTLLGGGTTGSYEAALEALAGAIDIKHIHIHGHSMRVGAYAAGIAQALGMGPHDIAGVRTAGYLHDIGYVAVDRHIFGKPGALNAAELRQITTDHSMLGFQIVKDVHFPWAGIPDVVRSHHERADRTGYPDAAPLGDMRPEVKIVALADTFDAMTSERPYRPRKSVGEALEELVKITPSKFDPETLQALILRVRRDAAATLPATRGPRMAPDRPRFLPEQLACNLFPSDIDQIAASLQHKLAFSRTHFDSLN